MVAVVTVAVLEVKTASPPPPREHLKSLYNFPALKISCGLWYVCMFGREGKMF